MREKANKYRKGITLIALVITIIVLIILAGVSINLVLGEDGIFKRAVEAREKTEQAAINEQAMLNSVYEEMTKLDNEDPTKTVEEAKTEGTYFDKKTELKDSDGNKVVVPEGFKIAEDSGNNVTEGIVIEDNDIQTDGNGEERGNQYVWIPVSNIDNKESNKIKKNNGEQIEITLGRYSFDDDAIEHLVQNGENYSDETVMIYDLAFGCDAVELATFHEGNPVYGASGINQTAKDLKGFVYSVRQNGGYYIARFEASLGKDRKFNSRVSSVGQLGKDPVNIGDTWGNTTQVEAAIACQNLYNSIESDLCNSYAWDTAVLYIQKFSGKTWYSNYDDSRL